MLSGHRLRSRLLPLWTALFLVAPLFAADEVIRLANDRPQCGEDLIVLIGALPPANADTDHGVLVFDGFAHLIAVRWFSPNRPVSEPAPADTTDETPPPADPAPQPDQLNELVTAADTPSEPPAANDSTEPDSAPAAAAAADIPPPPDLTFQPATEMRFPTRGLPAGRLTVKFGYRQTVDGRTQFVVLQTVVAELQPPAAAPTPPEPDTIWTPDKRLQFWRGTPLSVAVKQDWEALLADTGLAGADAPVDGATLVLPRGTVLSQAMIAAEIEPLLIGHGLLICETWPTPSMDDAVQLGTIVSPTAPVVQIPDVRPVSVLTGLTGPTILADPEPDALPERERLNRLLARRDPGHRRLYGLVESSFFCLTTKLKPATGTRALRYAADDSAAVTVRLLPKGGAVVVLNAPVQGYADAARNPATRVNYLGIPAADARALLAGAKGGIALRAALLEVHALLAARRDTLGETGPYWQLDTRLTNGIDRQIHLHAALLPTARTRPGWTPPTGLTVQLLHNGTLQEQAVLDVQNRRGEKTFRIPLTTDNLGWTLTVDDPFTGQTVTYPINLIPPIDLAVIDLPAAP